MNIAYIRMPGYDYVSVPSDAVVREMEKEGHHIHWLDNLEFLPTDSIDFVFSPYESVTLLGEAVSQILEVPHYSHIEWLPPWRIQKVDPTEYGMDKNCPELANLSSKQKHYKQVGKAWLNADVRSICAQAMVPFHSNFLGPITTKIRCPSIDYDTLRIAKIMYPEIPKVKNRILTVARCVPNKRYDLLIQAINKIQTKNVTWRIVGEGTILQDITQSVTNSNVTVELAGAKWGWDKIWEQMQAPIALCAFTSTMPPLESAFFDSYPVLYSSGDTKEISVVDYYKEIYKDFIDYAETSDEVADTLDEMLASKDRAQFCENITDACMKGEMGVLPSKQNAVQIIDRMKTYLKEKK